MHVNIQACSGCCKIFLGSLATNIIVSSMLILGGSATVADLTGISTLAVSPIVRLIDAWTQPL